MPAAKQSINKKNQMEKAMNTKNFFKTLACAMLMPAVLLTTSCSKGDDAVTNPEKPATTETAVNKGYALPVTVNVTRQDDGTRATYNESTKKLGFSAGDKLFVYGWQTSIGSGSAAGKFAGTLNYVSEGTFSGTIYTHNLYEGTLDDLLDDANAILLPAGYEDYGYLSISDNNTTEEKYDDRIVKTALHSFAASKKLAVEQLSYEEKGSYTSGTGFTLNPTNAILNFTVTGLAASTNVTATLTDGNELTIQGDVTTDAEGNATFAMGVRKENDLSELTLTVGSFHITLTDGSKTLDAGKIYNITRAANAINGKFTINSSGDQVYFSKGNLRYASGTWSFFDNQYDYYSTYSADAWDKFGWSTSLTTFGMSTSTTYEAYYGDFVDWGTVPGIGDGWYTLNSAEWLYLFGMETNGEDKSDHARYRKYFRATVNGVIGVVLLPDDISDISDIPTEENRGTASTFAGKIYTIDAWNALEAKGCVFLPAAGDRSGSEVRNYNEGYYWASNPFENMSSNASCVFFDKDEISPGAGRGRFLGHSVRLVRQVK